MVEPFDAVVREHGPALLRTCRAIAPSPADAEDLWSATFLAALAAYPQLRAGSNVRAWLVTIAHHKVIDAHRQAVRRPTIALSECERSAREPTDSLDALDLRAAVAALAPRPRLAVTYRYLAGLDYADVAALLGCSQPAARRAVADGIAVLRRTLNQEDFT